MTRTLATIEARMTSTRLPGKVLAEVQGKPMLELMVERLRRVPSLDGVVIATTRNASDDPVEALAARIGAGCWRGSEEDVLERVREAAHAHAIDVIVELTGDCPLIDPRIVEAVIRSYREVEPDYCANVIERSYPIGMDTQVFARDVLDDVARRTDDPEDHEHVSLYICRHPEIYRLHNLRAPDVFHRPELRLTLDTPEDLSVIAAVFDALYPGNPAFELGEILDFLDRNPEVAARNAAVSHRHV